MATDPSVFRRAAEATTRGAPALAWLQSARDEGLARFAVRGFPTTAEEDWRYTDLTQAARLVAELAQRLPEETVSPSAAWLQERLVPAGASAILLDGAVVPAMANALPAPGLSVRPLSQATLAEREALALRIAGATHEAASALPALNAALLRDGLIIEVAPGAIIEAPIYVGVASGADSSAQNRILLRLGTGARATVIEHHVSLAGSASNSVTDVICESGSHLAYVKLQAEADTAIHLATQRLVLDRGCRADLLHLDLGGRLSRNDLSVDLRGQGATAEAHGLFFADGSRHLDNHTRIDHRAPDTLSRELYRGIADGKGRGVFNGKVIVHAGASRTDAQLRNQNLLLAPAAEIDTKPELEIYADDVKCSHGATTGQLDAAAIFYLRSRGIPAHDARRMLIASFAREIVRRVPTGPLEGHVLGLLRERLPDLREIAQQS